MLDRRGSSRTTRALTAALLAVTVSLAGTAGAAVAGGPGPPQTPDSHVITTLCGMDQHLITNTGVDIRNNNFSGEPECITNWYGNPGFMITKSGLHAPWAAFPNAFVGCEISVCSPHSGMPIQVKNIKSLTSTWRYSIGGRWQGNAAYDIWFNPTYRHSGLDTGTEIMIWLATSGLDFAAGPIVTIDGNRWLVSRWVMHHSVTWYYVRFWHVGTVMYVRNLNLLPFLSYAEQVRNLSTNWWLTSVETGYELWSGAVGMNTTLFAVNLEAKPERG